MVQHNVNDTLLLPTDARTFATYWSVMDQWVTEHWHFIVFAALLAAALFAALTLLDKLAERWVASHEDDPRYLAILIRIAARTSTFFRFMVALEIGSDLV